MFMDTQSTLSIAAEIGIGIAGFSSIASAILSRSVTDDLDANWIQLRTLLQTSFAVTLLAYLPMVLGSAALSEPFTWRIGSSVYALWVAFVILNGHQVLRGLMKSHGVTGGFAIVTGLLGVASLSLNVLNAIFLGEGWPYLAALACGIAIAFILFGLLVRGLWIARKTSAHKAS